MKNIGEVFWEVSVEEMKKGYVFDEKRGVFTCIVCGKEFEKGIVYSENESLYEAEKYISIHIENEHDGIFSYLINMDKKYTGLTDNQKEIAKSFYDGLSDNEVVEKIGEVTTSTVRNYRFSMREKAKQAKVFLAIMELLEKKYDNKEKLVPVHRHATQIDERYIITEDENKKILEKYIIDGYLVKFPLKEKRKLVVLRYIADKFERGKKYNEKAVNEIIKAIYDDYVTIRRYLIEYGYMDRVKDGSEYWLK